MQNETPSAAENGSDPEAELVARFSSALLAKLRAAEKKYGWNRGWMKADWQPDLLRDIRRHIDKGDPIDVAAYAAFAWHHNWSTSTPSSETGEPAPDVRELSGDDADLVENLRHQRDLSTGWLRTLLTRAANRVETLAQSPPPTRVVPDELRELLDADEDQPIIWSVEERRAVVSCLRALLEGGSRG